MRKEQNKRYTDQIRYEHCRKYRITGKTLSEYARENEINRSTFKDWVKAYNNINGRFINVKTVMENENTIVKEKDVMLYL